jgi:tetratricopeptide (TPR) repeat protein
VIGLVILGLAFAGLLAAAAVGIVTWQSLPGVDRAPLSLGADTGATRTPQSLRTPRAPTAAPTPTSDRSYAERLQEALPGIDLAEHCVECEFSQVIVTWDEVLSIVPEYGPGYYGRSRAYLGLGNEETDFGAARQDLSNALNDIDRAIAMGGLVTGDYYLLRHDVYRSLGALEDGREERETLWRLAQDNLTMAMRLGSSDPVAPRTVVFDLVSLGDCDAGLAEAERLRSLIEPGDAPSAGIETAFGMAQLCRGDYASALMRFDAAIEIRDSSERQYARAIALYGLGRLDEALDTLNGLIEAQPTFNGYRYYLRALIRYDLGDSDLAEQDLWQGASNTWGRGGTAVLVEGLLARDAGNRERAIELFHLAETTLERIYTPMLERTQRELVLLEAEPATSAAPTPEILATPVATASPSPADGELHATPPAAEASYTSGTGMITLGWNEHQTFSFTPEVDAPVAQVQALTVRIEPTDPYTSGRADLFLWNPHANFWTMFPWQGEQIAIPHPGRFILPSGQLFLSVIRTDARTLVLTNVTVRLEVVLLDGTQETFLFPGE